MIETKNVETMPAGQAILRAGFKFITQAEIYDKLGCKEIGRLENQVILARVKEEANGAEITESSWAFSYMETITDVEKIKISWLRRLFSLKPRQSTCEISRHHQYLRQLPKMICDVKYQALDEYIKQQIPDECLVKVDEARKIGLSEFEVAYPELRPKGDPIIIGKLGDNMFYITEW